MISKCPLRYQKKGRPKGAGLTIIGLPKKRNVQQPSPFLRKLEWEKSKGKSALVVLMQLFKKNYSSDIKLVCGTRCCQQSHAK